MRNESTLKMAAVATVIIFQEKHSTEGVLFPYMGVSSH